MFQSDQDVRDVIVTLARTVYSRCCIIDICDSAYYSTSSVFCVLLELFVCPHLLVYVMFI